MHSDKYRAFIVELAMEWVEQRYREHIVVDQDLGEKMDGGAWLLCRDYTLPKMHVKGKLTEHRIRRVKRPAVEVVGETTTGASPVHRSQTEDGGIMPQQVTAESPSTTTLDATAAEAVEVQPSPPPHASITPCHTLVAESSASAFRADDHSPGALPPEYYVLTVELPGVVSSEKRTEPGRI